MYDQYKEIRFRPDSLRRIQTMNEIIIEYQKQGYVLTVRQLYYQLVARDIIPNDEKSYKTTASLINDARVAGMMDWDAIEDRTRSFDQRPRWAQPQDLLRAAANQFHTDPWATQDYRPFLIVEKEALVGVFQSVCRELDVPLLAARGYPSASVIREFAQQHLEGGRDQSVVVLHFGDHDPSGIDMTRDLEERIELFGRTSDFTLKRLALNYQQIEKYKPPPNPAKTTDARFVQYRRKYGPNSWELDALSPDTLATLARKEIEKLIDGPAWKKWEAKIKKDRARMLKLVETFEA